MDQPFFPILLEQNDFLKQRGWREEWHIGRMCTAPILSEACDL